MNSKPIQENVESLSRLEFLSSVGAVARVFDVPSDPRTQLELVASAAQPRIWIRTANGKSAANLVERDPTDPVKVLKVFSLGDVQAAGGVDVPEVGRILMHSPKSVLAKNIELPKDSAVPFAASVGAVVVGALVFLSVTLTRPRENPKIEAQLKAQVVQIVKRIQVKPVIRPNVATVSNTSTTATVTKATSKTAAIKRLGALSVLGSLKGGPHRGGLNLGAAQSTAGPGLGGSAGSGGVQSSLYGKGLVSAPLGAGGNMDGGGGYGTKGKGGGQAGYGKLSLVGSAGTMPIPMGREAIIGGGLDRDLIADVINRNLGQVRFCYEQGLQSDPALAGRVAVDFVINGAGTVSVASVGSTTLGSKIVEDCILMRLKTWKFPLPEGGTDVKVSYPFVLRRSGQG